MISLKVDFYCFSIETSISVPNGAPQKVSRKEPLNEEEVWIKLEFCIYHEKAIRMMIA